MDTKLVKIKGNKITIDIDVAKMIVKEGENFVLTPSGEEAIIQWESLKGIIEQLDEVLKDSIAKKLSEIGPNSKGIIGNRVKMIYRAFGGKYKYDWLQKSKLGAFLKYKEVFSVNSEAVDDYYREHGELPEGITEAEREKKISITVKDEEEKQINEDY